MQRTTFSVFPPDHLAVAGSYQPFRFRLADAAGTTIEITLAVPVHASTPAMIRMAYDAAHRALAQAAEDTAPRKLDDAERRQLARGLPPGAKG